MRPWEDLDLPASTTSRWYIVQCIAGTETLVSKTLEQLIPKYEGAGDFIEKIQVPTRSSTFSHGTKVLDRDVVLYPSYIFIEMYLREETYRVFRDCQKVSSFVGVRKPIKGTRMTCVEPRSLSKSEIERFNLNTKIIKGEIGGPKWEIGDMVRVNEGKHKGEVGAVRMVRDGQVSTGVMCIMRSMHCGLILGSADSLDSCRYRRRRANAALLLFLFSLLLLNFC